MKPEGESRVVEPGLRIRIPNWDKFQHYKNRRPPWIKVYRELLDKMEWFELSDGAARLLLELWILVSAEEDRGNLETDLRRLTFQLRKQPASDLLASLHALDRLGFIQLEEVAASSSLAHGQRNAIPERETEVEREESSVSSFYSETGLSPDVEDSPVNGIGGSP